MKFRRKLKLIVLFLVGLGLTLTVFISPASGGMDHTTNVTHRRQFEDSTIISIRMHEKAMNVPPAVSNPHYKAGNGTPRVFMQHYNNNDPEHKWEIKVCKNGGVGFKNVGNGRMMNIQPRDVYNGGRIGSWKGDDPCYPDQNFQIFSVSSSDKYMIISTRAGKALDAPWEGRETLARIPGNANLHLWTANDWNKNQIFRITDRFGTDIKMDKVF